MSENSGKGKRKFSFGLSDARVSIALLLTAGFLGTTAYALTKAGTISDVLAVLQLVKDPALAVVFFFFGTKASSK